jgi:hypothetical protein
MRGWPRMLPARIINFGVMGWRGWRFSNPSGGGGGGSMCAGVAAGRVATTVLGDRDFRQVMASAARQGGASRQSFGTNRTDIMQP